MQLIPTDMTVKYSAVVDLLILRGIHFLSCKQAIRKKINGCEDFLAYFQEYKEFNDDFHYGQRRLKERVDLALELLQSDKLLWLAPYSDNIGREDAILRDQVRQALPILDDVTFLREALFSWQSVKELACLSEWQEEVNKLSGRIEEIVPEMSCRLIPLNDYRREQLQSINPLFHPLFSWYEEEADVPATALEKMVELMIDHQELELPASLAELRERLEIMDPELHKHVHRRARASRLFYDTMARAPELRWEMARQVVAGTTPLVSQIVAAGLHRTALFSVYRRIVRPVPALEWRFLNAFCAPNLDAKQRQRTFAQVKNRLENDLADAHNSSVLASVNANLCNRLDDEELARELFVEWCSGREYGLEKTATWLLELPSLPEIDPNQLARLLDMSDEEAKRTAQNMLDLVREPDPVESDPVEPDTSLWDTLKGWIPQPSFSPQPSSAMGTGRKRPQSFTCTVNRFHFPMPQPAPLPNGQPSYSLLHGKESDDEQYTQLFKYLSNPASALYWRCVLSDGARTGSSAVKKTNRLPMELQQDDLPDTGLEFEQVQAILLVVSFEGDKLDNARFAALEEILQGRAIPGDKQEMLGDPAIVWFLYDKQERG